MRRGDPRALNGPGWPEAQSSFQRKLESHCLSSGRAKEKEIPAFAGMTPILQRAPNLFALIQISDTMPTGNHRRPAAISRSQWRRIHAAISEE
jgi:hypothetical protein